MPPLQHSLAHHRQCVRCRWVMPTAFAEWFDRQWPSQRQSCLRAGRSPSLTHPASVVHRLPHSRRCRRRQPPYAASDTAPSACDPGFAESRQPRSKRRRAPERGADVRLVLQLKFREGALGAQRKVLANVLRPCPTCEGMGAEQGSQVGDCTRCLGAGEVMRFSRDRSGASAQAHVMGVCPECGGSGTWTEEFCRSCGGEGRAMTPNHFTVSIPAGLAPTEALRLRGQGHSGQFGGGTGDIFLSFVCEENALIRRDGLDLHSDVVVPYLKAILGGTVQVGTLEGAAGLHVPPGTQHGDLLSLADRGVLGRAGRDGLARRGVHYYRVQLWVPTELLPEERSILERLSALRSR